MAAKSGAAMGTNVPLKDKQAGGYVGTLKHSRFGLCAAAIFAKIHILMPIMSANIRNIWFRQRNSICAILCQPIRYRCDMGFRGDQADGCVCGRATIAPYGKNTSS